jgi:hypothetical protein
VSTQLGSVIRVFLWLGALGTASIVFLGQGSALIGQGGVHGRTDAMTVFATPLLGGNDNNGGGNDNDDGGPPPAPAPAAAPAAPPCSTPGQDSSFASADGKFIVKVFGNMSRAIRLSVRLVDPSTVPGLPGTLVDRLVFEVLGEFCDGGGAIALLPQEINLGVKYSDADAAGLNEANFKIAALDPVDQQWVPEPKQAPDPGANFVSATIMRLGFFAVYQG